MNHQAWFGDNFGSPDTAHTFGPLRTAAGVSRLVRVRAGINFAFPASVIGTTDFLVQGVSWGVQAALAGYTPLVLPADMGGDTFLWSELTQSNSAGGAGYGPSSSTGVWAGYLTAWREWRGQLPIGGTADLYVSTGSILAGSLDFVSTYSVEVDYSD